MKLLNMQGVPENIRLLKRFYIIKLIFFSGTQGKEVVKKQFYSYVVSCLQKNFKAPLFYRNP